MKKTLEVPVWIEGKFSRGDAEKVEAAIGRVESATSGELVVTLARCSSAISHVGVISGFGAALLAVEVAWVYEMAITPAAALAFISLVFGLFFSRVSRVQRFLTSHADREMQVYNAAAAEFLRARVSHTQAGTGVLIYVSFMEHQVVVLGDSGIASKVKQSDWDEIVATILAGVKSGRFGDGLLEAVHKAGNMLSVHFPPVSGTGNEIHNGIRYLD